MAALARAVHSSSSANGVPGVLATTLGVLTLMAPPAFLCLMTAPVKHVWIALVIVYVVWGSTYFGIKVAVETIPPLLAAGSRFLVAGLLLAAILAWRGTALRISRRELGASAIVGVLLLGLGVGLVHVAETRIDSSVAAMIAGTVPLQIIALRLLAGESPARATRISTLAGLLGLLLVVAPGLGEGSTALGLAVMISATMSWTLGSFLSKRLALPSDPFVASVYEMSLGGLFLMVAAGVFGEYADVGSAHLRARLGARLGVPRRHGLARRLHGVCVAAPGRADLARRHAPVREPAGRDRPGHGVPRRAAVPVGARRRGAGDRRGLRRDQERVPAEGVSTCERRAARNSSRSDRVRIPDGRPSDTTTTAPLPPDNPS